MNEHKGRPEEQEMIHDDRMGTALAPAIENVLRGNGYRRYEVVIRSEIKKYTITDVVNDIRPCMKTA